MKTRGFFMRLSTKQLTKQAIVTAVYVAISLILSFMSYGGMQLRIAEALLLLCFYKKDYIISLSLGCLIVNLFSPLGMIDALFGTLATVISCLLIMLCRNIRLAGAIPAIVNGLIVGYELTFAYNMPYWMGAIQVAAGEYICVGMLGVVIFKSIERSARLMRLIKE